MKLKLPVGSFRAYLFDCDGTIADSMPLHFLAWKQALEEWNCEFEEQTFYEWGGMPVAEIISTLNQKHGLNMPVETVSRRKEGLQVFYRLDDPLVERLCKLVCETIVEDARNDVARKKHLLSGWDGKTKS